MQEYKTFQCISHHSPRQRAIQLHDSEVKWDHFSLLSQSTILTLNPHPRVFNELLELRFRSLLLLM